MSTELYSWINDREGRPDDVSVQSVHQCGLESVTDRLYSSYRTDTDIDVKSINLDRRENREREKRREWRELFKPTPQ